MTPTTVITSRGGPSSAVLPGSISSQANCPTGYFATGGGFTVTGSNGLPIVGTYSVEQNQPTPTTGTPTGWISQVYFSVSLGGAYINTYVVCEAS